MVSTKKKCFYMKMKQLRFWNFNQFSSSKLNMKLTKSNYRWSFWFCHLEQTGTIFWYFAVSLLDLFIFLLNRGQQILKIYAEDCRECFFVCIFSLVGSRFLRRWVPIETVRGHRLWPRRHKIDKIVRNYSYLINLKRV